MSLDPCLATECPACRSTRIVHGELRTDQSGHDVGNVAFFLPSTRTRFFLVSEPCVYPEGRACACLECGLLWSRVSPEKVAKLKQKYG